MKQNWRRHRPLFANTLPQSVKRPRARWIILPTIWFGIKRMATVLGMIMLLNIVIALLIIPLFASNGPAKPALPAKAVLFLDLEKDFPELPEFGGFKDPFATPGPTLQEAVDALDHAAADKRIQGLVARMGSGSFDLTHSYELRAAIKRFRAAGKFAYVYSPSYGEGGGGLGRYYLAAAFDEIWMQPLGVVSITGVSAEIPFAREVLDKIGITPQFFQRKEYKSAMETFTNKEISAANKEETTAIVNDIRAEILREVPLERKLTPAKFEALVHKGLLMAKEAEEANIIDHADYGDVLLENVAEKVYGKRDTDLVEFVDLAQYVALNTPKPESVVGEALGFKKPKVALVYAVGAIVQTAEGGGDFGDGRVVAADDLAPVLHDLAKDDNYSALVLRVDSPGGSPTASESILRAVQKVKESGKPVVISMGTAAASGGYWISAYGDRIFALPTTLTGSIGVFGGKVAIEELSKKIGVNWEKISWGQNAGLWSMNTPFTESEAERMNAMMDQVYDNFIERVAKGRKLSEATVDRIAGGRVWTGRRAITVGLVDEIGGLNEALDYAAKLSGGKSRADVQVDIMPKPKTKLEQFIELLGGQVAMGAQNWKVQNQILDALKPVAQIIQMQKNPQAYAVFEPLRLED